MNDRLEKLSTGTYNNLILIVLTIAGFYILVSGFNKSRQQTYLDGAGKDVNTQHAQALRDAMNRSGIALMMSVDGTDVDLIMSTAALITDYPAVSNAYRVLYPSSELTTDLQQELSRTDLAKFWDILYRRNGKTTTVVSNVGRTVTANQSVNIRQNKSPQYGRVRSAVKFENLGVYVSEKILPDVPNKGDRGTYVLFSEKAFGGLYTVESYVLKKAVTIG